MLSLTRTEADIVTQCFQAATWDTSTAPELRFQFPLLHFGSSPLLLHLGKQQQGAKCCAQAPQRVDFQVPGFTVTCYSQTFEERTNRERERGARSLPLCGSLYLCNLDFQINLFFKKDFSIFISKSELQRDRESEICSSAGSLLK